MFIASYIYSYKRQQDMAVCLAVMAGQDPLGRIEALEECRIQCHFAKKPTTESTG